MLYVPVVLFDFGWFLGLKFTLISDVLFFMYFVSSLLSESKYTLLIKFYKHLSFI